MISASEDRFTTDVSSNIQIYLKESHLDYLLWVTILFSTKNWDKRSILLSEVHKTGRISHISNEIEKSIGNDPRNHWRKARKATMDWIR